MSHDHENDSIRKTGLASYRRSKADARDRSRSLSDFVLESALGRAEETLADRHSFSLDAEKWAAFMAALDAPTRDLPRLKRLLSEPSIFSGRDPA
ncbi:DUF1778 domain-containing protein [Mesorhizobium sp.]|uniref:type II toxin-antitoxin system TacA family antitoxin n=1 Tax=Mesorhizobium sp. TaxID=1871066 RepID=UPI0025C22B4A|nr:DUF1778 domain-containing protein [Mesorhizobium sp.]